MNNTDTTLDTAFADRLIREAATVVSTDDSRALLTHIHLAPCDEGTRVTATDSYRAVTAVVDDQPFSEAMTFDPGKVNNPTWVDVVANAAPITGSYPNMERIFDGARAGTPMTPKHGRRFSGRGGWVDVEKWAYFDGERRKPNGIVELTVAESRLYARFGLQVKDERNRVPAMTLWEKLPRVLFGLADDEPDDDTPGRDIGVFHAGYLPNMGGIDEIRCGETNLSPLYLKSGKVEHVVMPIKMPEA